VPYVSDLLGKPVADVDGERIGTLDDLIATIHGVMPHPVVVAIAVKRPGGPLLVALDDVAVLIAPAIPLNKRLPDIVPYVPGENDIYLGMDVLDKQLIDTNGMRVVRVNDLELARVNGHFYVANVDIGGTGLLRRIGLVRITQRVAGRLRFKLPSMIISWDDVEFLPGDHAMRLKVPSERIAELHPADLAEIISDLSRAESSRLLETLDVETVADTLEEVEPDFQASLVETMPDEKVADILEEMSPDEAADLLAELPKERSEDLLELMEDEEAKDVRKLLAYPEDSAGGIMTTDYITIGPEVTAEQTLARLREMAEEVETIIYIYVTDEEEHLLGSFSLQDLVLAPPRAPATEFMRKRIVCVNVRDSQDEVAQEVAKYNLLAVPVVDDAGCLHGIVTADDALDKIIPTAWKKRLPRLYS
jgi:CBS domain-containing protein/sporulation protein YlmC with PRC-barrel domain